MSERKARKFCPLVLAGAAAQGSAFAVLDLEDYRCRENECEWFVTERHPKRGRCIVHEIVLALGGIKNKIPRR